MKRFILVVAMLGLVTGSLLPPKYDPLTGEEFPGNYIYNPFTGKKLVSR